MNTITVFANQIQEVYFYPEEEGKKPFALMVVAENMDVKNPDGEEVRMTTYYTVKAWGDLAESLAEEDKESNNHNKFYKIEGTLVTVKRVASNGKTYKNKEIHASKIELVYTPGIGAPNK